mmetsp:Transcript_26605/g.44654  ORF Transcript_26605/g.44654 Transcript_26605/m.44654 type:complete len:211 (-) Transcript_26605:98-730(-)
MLAEEDRCVLRTRRGRSLRVSRFQHPPRHGVEIQYVHVVEMCVSSALTVAPSKQNNGVADTDRSVVRTIVYLVAFEVGWCPPFILDIEEPSVAIVTLVIESSKHEQSFCIHSANRMSPPLSRPCVTRSDLLPSALFRSARWEVFPHGDFLVASSTRPFRASATDDVEDTSQGSYGMCTGLRWAGHAGKDCCVLSVGRHLVLYDCSEWGAS